MANPKKKTPWAIELYAGASWHALDAFRTEEDANDMLPIYKKRVPAGTLRVRNVFATQQKDA